MICGWLGGENVWQSIMKGPDGKIDDIHAIDTGEDTLTGGRIARIRRYVEGETFCLTYGDGLSNVNIRELLNFHYVKGGLLTLTAVNPPSKFGEMQISHYSDRVCAFNEKAIVPRSINGGFMVCDPAVFDYIEGDEPFERRPIERLVAKGEVFAFRHSGFWHAMDTYADYLYLNELWAKGNAPWTL